MHSMKYVGVAALILSLWLPAAVADDLGVGSKAPDLSGAKWIKGSAVDLAAAKGKQITVVEFWATWCPPCVASIPHLTKLQSKYADGSVRIVGVTQEDSRNTHEKVTQFVKRMGDKMDYTVGFDADGKLGERFMDAAGQGGIPTAFVIDKAGRIAWIGYPDGALDEVIAELADGTFDMDEAKRIAKFDRRLEEAEMFGEWDLAADLVRDILKIKPKSYRRWKQLFEIQANYLGNSVEATKCLKKAFRFARGNPQQVAELASIVTTEDDADGFNKLALAALERARKDYPNDTDLRMAQFGAFAATGRDADALKLASETIERLKGDGDSLSQFAGVLSSPARAKKCGDLALRAVVLAIDAEPDEPRHYATKFFIQHQCKNDVRGANDTGHYLIEKAAGDADFLNGFAWGLLTEESTKGKFNALALAAAEAMSKAPGGDGWSHLDTLALARFENGNIDSAIKVQKEAIKKCDNENARASLTDALKRYEGAKSK